MKMKLGTPLNILIFKQFQKIDNLQLCDRRAKQKLEKQRKKITQIALKINTIEPTNIITFL